MFYMIFYQNKIVHDWNTL